jgi:hypothetical protein
MRNQHGTEAHGRQKATLAFFQLVRQFEIRDRKWGKWQPEHYLGIKRPGKD